MTTPSPDVPAIAPVPGLPDFRWNVSARRYIAPNGRFVSSSAMRAALDQFIVSSTEAMVSVSSQLRAAEITLAQWQTEMMLLVKEVNLAGGAMEAGGWYQMTAADFGRVGRAVRDEYAYLSSFAGQIADGTQPLDGTLARRARLYGQQGRATYYNATRARAGQLGFDEERSVLTPADHCSVCVEEAAAGFRPMGVMVPIGQRTCRSNCRCYVQYRNSTTGEVKTV